MSTSPARSSFSTSEDPSLKTYRSMATDASPQALEVLVESTGRKKSASYGETERLEVPVPHANSCESCEDAGQGGAAGGLEACSRGSIRRMSDFYQMDLPTDLPGSLAADKDDVPIEKRGQPSAHAQQQQEQAASPQPEAHAGSDSSQDISPVVPAGKADSFARDTSDKTAAVEEAQRSEVRRVESMESARSFQEGVVGRALGGIKESITTHVGGCWDGMMAFLRAPKDFSEQRDDFERTVKFLESVPLFKKQLPRSELPKVARHLSRIDWTPNQTIIKQGEMGRSFFLIMAGEAAVTDYHRDPPHVATLYPGDYFGGHTLNSDRPNVASISAQGSLTTLSMSRTLWESSGLKKRLRLPKREALYKTNSMRDGSTNTVNTQISKFDQALIVDAIERNVNLAALLKAKDNRELIKKVAGSAELRKIAADDDATRMGDMGKELFIVAKGTFAIVIGDTKADHALVQRSAESYVANTSMSERLRRKQAFFQDLYRPISPVAGASASEDKKNRRGTRHHSVLLRDPRADRTPKGFEVKETTSVSPRTQASQMHMARGFSMSQSAKGFCLPEDERASGSHRGKLKKGASVVCLNLDDTSPARLQLTRHDSGEYGMGGVKKGFQGVGVVSAHHPGGVVRVQLTSGEQRLVDGDLLRPYEEKDDDVVAIANVGDSFGELSLLYNTRREATFRAREDSEVFVIKQEHLKQWFCRRGRYYEKDIVLLDEVVCLTPLLRSERMELAYNIVAHVDFKPGDKVITQGKRRSHIQWYVIASGSAVVTRNSVDPETGEVTEEHFGEIVRAGHFGERSLLRSEPGQEVKAEVSISAGEGGMRCITFDGVFARTLLEGLKKMAKDHGESFMPCCESDVKDWFSKKAGPKPNLISLANLTTVCHLGRGAFGSVDLMKDKKDKQYAVKKMSKGLIKKADMTLQICWERDLMLMVDSPFVIRLYRTCKDSQYIYFIMESALGGNLYQTRNSLPEIFKCDEPRGSTTAFYVACVVLGLEHLHERNIVYRDLKPENVLMDERGYCKLCDMGFARFVIEKTNTLAGTPEYMAPEMIEFPHAHDTTADWWALGVLTFELVAGQTPFEDEGVVEPDEKILAIRRSQLRGDPRFPMDCGSHIRSFVCKLLRPYGQRLGSKNDATEVREHKWFQRLGLDFEALLAQTLPTPYAPKVQRESRMEEKACSELFCAYQDDGTRWDEDF